MNRKYKGFSIYRCERVDGQHSGKWIVQTYHKTGNPYADELCPHYRTLSEAYDAINRGEMSRG